jgi:hypothetical protein
MEKRFFRVVYCPVCAKETFAHRRTGILANHGRTLSGRPMPRCPMIGLNVDTKLSLATILAFSDACEAYRQLNRGVIRSKYANRAARDAAEK